MVSEGRLEEGLEEGLDSIFLCICNFDQKVVKSVAWLSDVFHQ